MVIGIIAIFGPIFFHVGSSHDVDIIFIVYSLFWQFESQGGPLVFLTIFVGGFLLFIPLRIIFVWQMYRCYENCTSKKRAVVIGLIAELQTLVTFLMLPHTPYPQMTSPIPLLFLTGMLFLITVPPREVGMEWITSSGKLADVF